MTNMDLEELIRVRSHVPRARLPKALVFNYDENKRNLSLFLSQECLEKNMQDNSGAFESWALVLKYYLSDIIDTVTIDWDPATEKDQNPHFKRFVYRLDKFLKTYEWVKTNKKLPVIPILTCNCPIIQEAASADDYKDNTEGRLENEYVDANKSNYDVINHQFPVGLFDRIKSHKTRYTPGNKSAIDIWAIKENRFYIFELKKDDNKPLGIISEILFYTNVIIDIFSRKIKFEEDGKEFCKAIDNNARGFKDFYDYSTKVVSKTINPVLLANNIHPIITEEFLDFVNDSPRWANLGIHFSKQTLNNK